MNYYSKIDQANWSRSAPHSPWGPTARQFATLVRERRWIVVACALAGLGAGVAIKAALPAKYEATTQLLFDPRGFKLFNNDLTTGNYDSNAAINYVESQMGVLQSERVLTRMAQTACASIAKAGDDSYGLQAKCPKTGARSAWEPVLTLLRRSLTVKRTERSFVVDVTMGGQTPDIAARRASAIVAAYVAEDAATRNDAAARLTADLSGRLDTLRSALAQSEAKAQRYRKDKNLVRVGDRLIVEQRLTSATTALNNSQIKLDHAAARLTQIEAAANNPNALGALGAETDTRTLVQLLDQRNKALLEIAPLAARVGARHPLLLAARSSLAETNRAIAKEMHAIRFAARADLARARNEQQILAESVSSLSDKVTHARQAEIELRAIEQEVDANRKLLESFETRSREAKEFGRIDTANLRIVSMARPPEHQRAWPKLAAFSALGLFIGALLALAGLALYAGLGLLRAALAPYTSTTPAPTPARRQPLPADYMPIEIPVSYRFG